MVFSRMSAPGSSMVPAEPRIARPFAQGVPAAGIALAEFENDRVQDEVEGVHPGREIGDDREFLIRHGRLLPGQATTRDLLPQRHVPGCAARAGGARLDRHRFRAVGRMVEVPNAEPCRPPGRGGRARPHAASARCHHRPVSSPGTVEPARNAPVSAQPLPSCRAATTRRGNAQPWSSHPPRRFAAGRPRAARAAAIPLAPGMRRGKLRSAPDPDRNATDAASTTRPAPRVRRPRRALGVRRHGGGGPDRHAGAGRGAAAGRRGPGPAGRRDRRGAGPRGRRRPRRRDRVPEGLRPARARPARSDRRRHGVPDRLAVEAAHRDGRGGPRRGRRRRLGRSGRRPRSRLPARDPYPAAQVTVRDFLTHRSGLPGGAGNDLEAIGYGQGAILHRLRLVPPSSSFRAGYSYSNFGFTEGALAAARPTGKAWEAVAGSGCSTRSA